MTQLPSAAGSVPAKAAIVAPRRLTYLYAALAAIGLLLEQGYWELAHDAPTANFLQPGMTGSFYDPTVGLVVQPGA
mgnify:CR=1 FL=1